MKSSKSLRLILINSTIIFVVLAVIVGVGLNSSPVLAQDAPPSDNAAATTPSAGSGDGTSDQSLASLPLAYTGDGLPQGSNPASPTAVEFGPDVPSEPNVVFSYFRYVGTAFNPRTTTTTFAYIFNGCVYQTGGTDARFMAPLLLPANSTIKFLRLYYDDTAVGSDITAWITRYQPGITSEDLTSVYSSGSSGYGTTLSAEITHTVDLTNWAYTIIIGPGVNSAANSFCGVRVAYYAPPYGLASLPVVIK